MPVSNTNSETFYTGNASTTTGYSVDFDYISEDHIYVATIARGTGTVTITAGVVAFTDAQATLLVGSRLRIAGTTYVIDTRTSSTAFTITDHTVTVASSNFHLPDDEDVLTEGEFILTEVGAGSPYVTTPIAVAATALVRVYREVPYTQLIDFPSTGPIQTASISQMGDLLEMQIQQLATRVNNSGAIVPATSGSGG